MVKKLFKQMLLAQVVSAMAVMLTMLVDSIMIGQFLGARAIAAYGFANPLILLVSAVANTLSNGTQVVCSNALGSGKNKVANAYFSVATVLSVTAGFFFVLLVVFFRGPLASFLGAAGDDTVFQGTKDYLLGFIIGAPGVMFAMVMIPFMQFTGERIRLVAAVLTMTVTDIVLDFLNVKIFHLGMFGMGLASSLSYYLAILIGLAYFLSKRSVFKFRWRAVKKIYIIHVLVNGTTTIINLTGSVLLTFLLNNLLAKTGANDAVAAYSILNNIINLSYSILFGITSVTLMLAGIFYGEDDRKELQDLVSVSSRFSVFSHLIMMVVVIALAPILVGFFISGDQPPIISQMAITGTRIFAFSLVPCVLNASLKNYYQGIEKMRLAQVIAFMQNFGGLAIFALLLSPFLGTNGVWLCYPLGELGVLLMIAIIVWKKNKAVNLKPSTFAMLDEDFGVSEEDTWEMEVRSYQESADASRSASEFCNRKSGDSKTSMYISVCIEEMANNTLKFGFKEGKDNYISLKLTHKDGNWLLRIRDNCHEFNPVKYHDQDTDPDLSSGFGIRMVFKIAKKIKYTYNLSMNNLMIRL
ncbi:MAG: ATP-binding protein [Eubacterium sp.]|nr:ATP-binding protein [Eubacterium sp.]